ncbi:Chitinase 4 [Spathaspora sp. JA1]|nr:Chitinase 4 [Spathaspora sp. JA1]
MANKYISGVYFSNWSVYQRKHFAIDIPATYYTHIFYAFLHIDPDTGNLKFTDEWCDLQMPLPSAGDPTTKVTGNLAQLYSMKCVNRHLKVIMSIGGWGTCHLFEAITCDSTKLGNFVESVVEFVNKYKFDGIDLDWEYPKTDKDAINYVKLLQCLRRKLPDHSISIAAPGGGENIRVLHIKEMDQYLTFWNLMCYDFSGQGWSNKTGYHSNLFGNNGDNELNVDQVIQLYMSKGVSSNKLILGMPMYGRTFGGVGKPTIGQSFVKSGADTVDYKEIPILGEQFDSRKVSAYYYNASLKQFITYDNPQSARIKAKYTISKQLGGGMWWDSAGDSPDPARSLVINYVETLGGVDVLEKSTNNID